MQDFLSLGGLLPGRSSYHKKLHGRKIEIYSFGGR